MPANFGMPPSRPHVEAGALISTAQDTIVELATQLGRHLDSKEKLESALTAAIQTAFEQHNSKAMLVLKLCYATAVLFANLLT